MKPQKTSLKPLPDTLNAVASDGSDVAGLVGKKNFVCKLLTIFFVNYTSGNLGENKVTQYFF